MRVYKGLWREQPGPAGYGSSTVYLVNLYKMERMIWDVMLIVRYPAA